MRKKGAMNNLMTRYLFVLLVLAGCATPEDAARQRAAYASALRAQCAGYGFKAGTPEMAQCVMRLDQAQRQAEAANSAAAIQQGQALMQSSQPYRTNSPSVECSPSGMGGVRCQ
jgi:hypothetical protein